MFDYMLEQAYDNLLYDYSKSNLLETLSLSGVVDENSVIKVKSLRRLVFVDGSKDEVYSHVERELINSVENVYVFPDFVLPFSREYIHCRCICADLSNWCNPLFYSILFMKIIIKALEGFTFFLIRTSDGLQIGTKIYEKEEWNNCTICEAKDSLNVLRDFFWINDKDSFIAYYKALINLVKPYDDYSHDYDELVLHRRGINREYISMLHEIELYYDFRFNVEIERYLKWCDSPLIEKESYSSLVNDNLLLLKNIRSSKVNTLEMLFESEILEELSIQSSENNTINNSEEGATVDTDNSHIELISDDPEEILKMLKLKG